MTKRFQPIMRKAMPLLGAGVLLQAGGCNSNEVLSGLLTSIVGSILQNLVYGSFNLV